MKNRPMTRPLLVKHCYECHSGTKTMGGLSLDTQAGRQTGGDTGPAMVPGNLSESLLIEAVNYGSLEMPPPEKAEKLSADEIAILTKWVAMGAQDPRVAAAKIGGMTVEEAKSWWAFQPLPIADAAPSPERIDGFIQCELEASSIKPSPAADKRTLIRRATFDLTGLPPTPAEVDAFIAGTSPDAFANIVERLLASPQYGVQWGRHWLDVVRYADKAGENTDRPLPHAWRYGTGCSTPSIATCVVTTSFAGNSRVTLYAAIVIKHNAVRVSSPPVTLPLRGALGMTSTRTSTSCTRM